MSGESRGSSHGLTPGQPFEVPGAPNFVGFSAFPVVTSNTANGAGTTQVWVNQAGSHFGQNWPLPSAGTGWPGSQFGKPFTGPTNYSWQKTVNALNVNWQGLPATDWMPVPFIAPISP